MLGPYWILLMEEGQFGFRQDVCLRTKKPASLFVVHEEIGEHQANFTLYMLQGAGRISRYAVCQDARIGFAHEGLPAFGCFLGYNSILESWYASLGVGRLSWFQSWGRTCQGLAGSRTDASTSVPLKSGCLQVLNARFSLQGPEFKSSQP